MSKDKDGKDDKDDRPNRPKDGSREEYSIEEVSPTVYHTYEAIYHGKKLDPDIVSLDWQGEVYLSKDFHTIITDQQNKPKSIILRTGKKHTINLAVLQQIIRKTVQEGPEAMRVDWYASGESREENPLKFKVVNESVMASSASSYEEMKTRGVPSLG